jgi:hypothetical protein
MAAKKKTTKTKTNPVEKPIERKSLTIDEQLKAPEYRGLKGIELTRIRNRLTDEEAVKKAASDRA